LSPLRFPSGLIQSALLVVKRRQWRRIHDHRCAVDQGNSVRRLYTAQQLADFGASRSAIRWGEGRRWRRVVRGVYAEGPEDPTPLDRAIAMVVATDGIASGTLAATLLGLDGVKFAGADLSVEPAKSNRRSGVRRRTLAPERVTRVGDVRCTDGLQTLVDLADALDDLVWEQALESALRRRLAMIGDVERAARGSQRGVARMRRVLTLRPDGAPPTESLLETLMVQLARSVAGLAPPSRQVRVSNEYGEFVARVDLAWPELGLFVELDGQHHRGQPVYDARRETAIVAATGWLCGRFTWHEVAHLKRVTVRRLASLAEQGRRRPLAPSNAGWV
jgi:very-short-patch-repair endonuclease